MPYSSQLTIEELSSTGDSVTRSVTLAGPSLPFMGAEWKAGNQLTTTWYPGNNEEATQQVLGAREMPSSWQGEWNRTRMGLSNTLFVDDSGNSQFIAAPHVLRDALEGMFRDGQRLRVTWAVESDGTIPDATDKLIREGRAKDWSFKYTRLQDIAWEITFDWVSRGQGSPIKATSTRADTVVSNSAAYQQALQALINANQLAQLQQFNPSSLNLGQLEQLANYPTALVTSLSRQVLQLEHTIGQVINIATTLASQPLHVRQAAVNAARNAVSLANQFYVQVSQVPCELQTNKRSVAAILRANLTFGAQGDDARALARQALIFVKQLLQQVQAASLQGEIVPLQLGDPTSISQKYLTKAGDTPTKISQMFYRSPDFAVDILRANRLSWYTVSFDPGTVLVIPVLETAAGSSGGA